MATTTTITHDERRHRRKQIANEIKGGQSIATVCKTYGVTLRTVRDSCAEYGVEFPKPKRQKSKSK